MKYALFPGCKIPYYVSQYETSSRAVLGKMGVELEDIEFSCCGYPVRHLNFQAFLLSGARNLALAERNGLDIITPCKCCFGTLKKAVYLLKEKPSLRELINRELRKEGLEYGGDSDVKHVLSVLFHEVGLVAIAQKIVRPFIDLKIAVHYGCHALRPGKVVQFDNPMNPTLFEKLVEVTGAQSIEWPRRLQCCGNPLWGKNSELAVNLAESKLADAREQGADYLCVACTYCHIQFDHVQQEMLTAGRMGKGLPSILYPQLLGLSMGMDAETVGIGKNRMDTSGVVNFLFTPEEESAASQQGEWKQSDNG